MAIKIIKPGIFTTIQDLGRNGYRSAGIGPGGAMDFFAASVANVLVGNDEKSPLIEMHFPAVEILFQEDVLVSVTGGNFNGFIEEKPVLLWKPFIVKKNEKLSFKKYIDGARAYLAVKGGISADKWLNSFSTHPKIKAGGYKGRPLLKDDTIQLNASHPLNSIDNFPDSTDLISPVYNPINPVRCIAGPEWEWLNEASKAIFTGSPFTVTPQSDRMGFRLQGMHLDLQESIQLISSPVDMGTIQLLPNGQLILLMADHQTTGGYPRIANVISYHLPKLAQSPIHNKIQFEMISPEIAEDALFSLHQTIRFIKDNCQNYYAANRHQL